MSMEIRRSVRLLLSVILAAACAAALFWLCYRADNKYTVAGPRGEHGVLVLSEQDLREKPLIYLTTGWEIYRGKLLAPQDFASGLNLPDEYVFIGQYGGLEGSTKDGVKRGPHGSATYRLNIALPAEVKSYTLELPEIYSAYHLYINGELLALMGDPARESYRAETGISKVTFRCADRAEIIVAAADYSHSYSGMVYPPAFGEPAAVESALNTRFAVRSAVIALSLGIGLFYFGIWLILRRDRSDRSPLPLYYAALCLCFALFICYPAIKTLWTSGMGWYALERLAYPGLLLLVTLIQSRVCGISGLYAKLMAALGIFTCGFSLAVPLVMGGSLGLMMAYSHLLTAFTWLTALYLLAASVYGVHRSALHSRALLLGAVVFGVCLVMDRLLPLFEPIRFGWFSELSGGFYVLLIGGVMARDVAGQLRLRLQLEGRVESVTRMMEVQKAYYPEILKKEEELTAARHDFRHHMAAIRELADAGELEKLTEYTQSLSGSIDLKAAKSYCKHYVTDMLLRMYAGLAENQDIEFSVEATLPEELPFADIDLCVILSNLLENALEASLNIPAEDRWIAVYLRCRMGHFGVAVENAFDGVTAVQNGHFLSRKRKGREGIGLRSVRAICERHGGNAEFDIREDTVFRGEALLPLGGRDGETA